MRSPLEASVTRLTGIPASALGLNPSLPRILNAIRNHLDMDVAFISEIKDGRRYFRHVDGKGAKLPISVGASDPVEESYCARVIDGRLPELIPDACVNAEALTLAATRALPVGAHLSVPIRLADGSVYGTFCCFSFAPNATLTERDLSVMRVLADMVGDQVQQELDEQEGKRLLDDRLDAVLSSQGLRMVYQPIVRVATGRVVAFEALARFATDPYRPPDVWFAEAAHAGRSNELETLAIRMALAGLAHIPQGTYIAVNVSPETIVEGALAEALQGFPLDRIVVEITEHRAIECYEDILAAVAPLKARGLRIAIDDAGAGYASFRHILNLHPEIVKLDVSITRSINCDRSRRALAAALCGFASETDCQIVAEGVETAMELQVIKDLGISKVQGYHLGKPMPLTEALALL